MTWRVVPLSPDLCDALAPHVSEEDRLDLIASGYSPQIALYSALLEPGEPWAVLGDGDHVLGAFGWTEAGTIWSMWRPLTIREKATLLKHAPQFIRAMVTDSGDLRLGNVVYEGNEGTIAWLRATKCFTFLDSPLTYGNRTYVPFIVTPQNGDPANV